MAMAHISRRHYITNSPFAPKAFLFRAAAFTKYTVLQPDDGEIDLITLRRRARGIRDDLPAKKETVDEALKENNHLPRSTFTLPSLAKTAVDKAILEMEQQRTEKLHDAADTWTKDFNGHYGTAIGSARPEEIRPLKFVPQSWSPQSATDAERANAEAESKRSAFEMGGPASEKYIPQYSMEDTVAEKKTTDSASRMTNKAASIALPASKPESTPTDYIPVYFRDENPQQLDPTPKKDSLTRKPEFNPPECIPVYFRDENPHQMNPMPKNDTLVERDRPLMSMDEPLNYGRSSVYPEPDLEQPYPAPDHSSTPAVKSSPTSSQQPEPEWTGLDSCANEDLPRNPSPTPQFYLLLSTATGSPRATLLRSAYPPPLENVVPPASLLPYFDLLHKRGLQLIGGNSDVLVWTSGAELEKDLLDEINKPWPRIPSTGEEMARREWRRRQRRARMPKQEQVKAEPAVEEKRVGWVRGFMYTGLWVGGITGALAALGGVL